MTLLGYGLSLYFSSRIEAAARRAGSRYLSARGDVPLVKEAERVRPSLVLIELERIDLDEVRALRARDDFKGIRVLAFGAHAAAERMAEAREAGCEVVARSGLVRRLEAMLGE